MEKFDTITLDAQAVKAAHMIAAKKDARYYLQGIHLNKEKNRIESADGCAILTIDNAGDITNLPKNLTIQIIAPAQIKKTTKLLNFNGVEIWSGTGTEKVNYPFIIHDAIYPNLESVLIGKIPDKNTESKTEIILDTKLLEKMGKAFATYTQAKYEHIKYTLNTEALCVYLSTTYDKNIQGVVMAVRDPKKK